MTAIEKFGVGKNTVEIHTDDNPSSPRENSNLGKMVCWHRRYNLGDKHDFKTPQEFHASKEYKNAAVILPLYLFDHSGLSLSTSKERFEACDSQRWDWGQVGYIYATKKEIREAWNIKSITKAKCEQVKRLLQEEADEYSKYLNGEVYGYIIRDEHGKELDSCWGFIGLDWVRDAATEAASPVDVA